MKYQELKDKRRKLLLQGEPKKAQKIWKQMKEGRFTKGERAKSYYV